MIGHDDKTFNDVTKLADISRPTVSAEHFHCIPGDGPYRPSKEIHKMVHGDFR